MSPALDAVIYIAEPPTLRIDSAGLVHITQPCGGMCIEQVMPLKVFMRTVHLAKKAIAEYEARGTAEVIDFPKRAH